MRYLTALLTQVVFASFAATCCWASTPTEQNNVREASVYHIIVRTQTQAQSIYDKLSFLFGKELLEQFSKFAATSSFDAGSAKVGGSLGRLLEGSMVEEFDRPVFQSQPMTLLAPFKSRYGWHVVYVEDVKVLPVAHICSKAANRDGSDISPKDKEFARSVGPLLSEEDRKKVATIIGDQSLALEPNSEGTFSFVLTEVRRQPNWVEVTEHFELPYAKLVASSEPPTCTRSYDQTMAVDCPNKRFAILSAVGYANRASLGRAHPIYRLKDNELKFIELGDGAEDFVPFKVACSIKFN